MALIYKDDGDREPPPKAAQLSASGHSKPLTQWPAKTIIPNAITDPSRPVVDVAVAKPDEPLPVAEVREMFTTARVRVRAEPNTKSVPLLTLEKGARLTSSGVRDGWHRISYENSEGWVRGGQGAASRCASRESRVAEMQQSLSREELYQLVWARPVRDIASEHGVSDVGFAKMCRKHSIPLPPRGYWAKVGSGAKASVEPLPVRGFGMPEIVRSGRARWDRYSIPKNLEEMDIPPPPEFTESEEQLSVRVRKLIGTVSIPRDLNRPHHQISRLLKEDEVRRDKQSRAKYLSLSDGPLFDFPFERRRLRLLSGLFIALQREGMSVIARKQDPDDFEVTVGEQTIFIKADHPEPDRYGWRSDRDANRPASAPMTVEISHHRSSPTHKTWSDRPHDPVEGHATDIVVSVIVFAEMNYREGEINHHRWLVQHKQQLIEDRRKRHEEAIRAAAEARVKAEKARVDRLLGEASTFRQAQDIRAYVEAARRASADTADPVPQTKFEAWAQWAHENADRIDPVLSRAFLRDRSDDQ
ncbi:SH3 domain-containing protein [Arvimicrobium flavum]|uniref:SH3 domain-containing protein n=1 Tax=Arvimicrobium flavum TaxID=3393320 RepID=UPI00237C34EE|nr:SH3 domain-containing protein [Mesorhizobium shangrilense]